MDTSKMKYLEKRNGSKMYTLFTLSEELKSIAGYFFDSMDTALLRTQIVEALKGYDLGDVIDVYEIFGGYVNRSFGIITQKDGVKHEYFVRKYKYGITEKEIVFEHSMIDYSIIHGLDIAAKLFKAKDGKTFVKQTEGSNEDTRDIYFAVYQFLEGEDKYTWDNPTLNDAEYASAAEVLATFHNAARDFDPQGLERVEPKIMELLLVLPEEFKALALKKKDTKFHKYYNANLEAILEVMERSQIPKEVLEKIPLSPCHCDFHPGNLKYKDNKVVGIFDFDWSKIDHRLFDVTLALAYCCSSWQDGQDGVLLLEKCAIFLKSYQEKLAAMGGLEPLSPLEIENLPAMLAAANIYLINWDVTAYYRGTDLNEYEYLAYLMHNVRLMYWIESHKAEILAMAKSEGPKTLSSHE